MAKSKRYNQKVIPSTWEEAMQHFLLWKRAGALSDRTIDDYKVNITRFFNRYPGAFDEKKLKSAIIDYMGQPSGATYYNLKLIYLRAFFNWCIAENILTANPLIGFKKRREEGRVVNIDLETLKRLLELPDHETFSGLRDYTLMLLTLDTGVRPKEGYTLLLKDVNLNSLEITIRAEAAKTRVTRTLPISVEVARAIGELIDSRHPAWNDKVPLFCGWEGNPFKINTWQGRLQMYSKKLGVKITPYFLRHAFAINYLRNGGNAFALQRTLGHTDLAMTKRYVALTQQDLRQQHMVASPINQLLPKRNRINKLHKP